MIVNSLIYILVWIAVIVVGYYLICGVAKITKEDKPGEGSSIGGCLVWIIIIGGIAIIVYAFYALGGQTPSLDTPASRY